MGKANLEIDVTREPDWTDLRVPMSALATVTGAGLKAPTYSQLSNDGAGSTGLYAAAYSPTQEQELFFAAQLPHAWREGTELRPHIHWSPSNTANVGDVVWGLEYYWVNVNELIPNSTITTGTFTVDGTGRKHVVQGWPVIDGTGKKISSQIHGRIFRDADNILDTYPDPAFLIEVDFHYQQDSIGSNSEFVK